MPYGYHSHCVASLVTTIQALEHTARMRAGLRLFVRAGTGLRTLSGADSGESGLISSALAIS
jgi:hypothetical protein